MFLFLYNIIRLLKRTFVTYRAIDGDQRAAAVAYYAFFSLLPLLLLFVTIASMLPKKESVTEVISHELEKVFAFNEAQQAEIIHTVRVVLESRAQAGIIAICFLMFTGQQVFQSIVRAINVAWGFQQSPWWHLPLKNIMLMTLVAAPLFMALVLPVFFAGAEKIISRMTHIDMTGLVSLFDLATVALPTLILFYSLYMVYQLAPGGPVHFYNIWLATVVVTFILQIFQLFFFWFIDSYGRFNAIYGAFSTIVILLLWIFFSANIIIIGACLCVAHAEIYGPPKALTY